MKRLLILTTLGLFLAAHCAVAVMTVSVLSVHPIVVASELHLSRNGRSASHALADEQKSILHRVGGQVIQFLNRRSL
jgi:hypothetical protein